MYMYMYIMYKGNLETNFETKIIDIVSIHPVTEPLKLGEDTIEITSPQRTRFKVPNVHFPHIVNKILNL